MKNAIECQLSPLPFFEARNIFQEADKPQMAFIIADHLRTVSVEAKNALQKLTITSFTEGACSIGHNAKREQHRSNRTVKFCRHHCSSLWLGKMWSLMDMMEVHHSKQYATTAWAEYPPSCPLHRRDKISRDEV